MILKGSNHSTALGAVTLFKIMILKGSNLSITMGATHGLTNTNRNQMTPAGV